MTRAPLAAAWLAASALIALGCRTQIQPYTRPAPAVVYVGDRQCNVYEFVSATDLPDGSRSLGEVRMDRVEENEEQTYVQLRQKVCELGGNATTSMAWVRDASAETENPNVLKAEAWALP